ncbi:MAG: hypothetical protein ACUVXD_02380 [Thermodesulfobacteriota bacterium]
MGFKFRYQRLLDHRREMERMATLRAARAHAARDLAAHDLAEAIRTEEIIGRQWWELVGRHTLMRELLEIRARWRTARETTAGHERALREREEVLSRARDDLLAAAKAKEVLLRLRDRALDEFAGWMRRMETVQLDEASLRPFAVRREASGEGDTSPEVP